MASSAQAVLAKILMDDAPAPTKTRASIPANVDAAIRRALEKLPADRFTGAQEFARALADAGFRHGEEVAASMAGGGGPWKEVSMALGALALVFGMASMAFCAMLCKTVRTRMRSTHITGSLGIFSTNSI